MRRIFGVEPVSLFAADGLAALARLDTLAQRVRAALADLAGDIRRAVEIGRGLDKVLLADHGDRYVDLRAPAVPRPRALRDGDPPRRPRRRPRGQASCARSASRSQFGITVRGDYIRFADPQGIDLGRVSIPWIAAEDRDELARRIGQLVHAPVPIRAGLTSV